MSDDRVDPILDACLDEVLGGSRPPDLTERVLASWEAAKQAALIPPAESAPPRIVARNTPTAHRLNQRVARRRSSWNSLALAAGALAVTSAIGLLILTLAVPDSEPDASVASQPAPSELRVEEASEDRLRDEPADEQRDHGPLPDLTDVPFGRDVERALPPLPLTADVQRQSNREVLTSIDSELRAAWSDTGVTPAAAVNDPAWCHRVYTRVLGRPPRQEELAQFLAVSVAERRRQLLPRLFSQADTRGEFAGHWSRIWAHLLVGEARGRKRALKGLQQYLEQAFRDGRPFDQIATQLLTASGPGDPQAEDYDGAANYMFAVFDKDLISATGSVARVFLSQRLDCAQCHDHPWDDELTQRQFWELNAFLRQTRFRIRGKEIELYDADFLGEKGGNGADSPIFYETGSGELKAAYPGLTGAGPVPRSGLLARVNRRQWLVRSLTPSPRFSRAIVNQCWRVMFSRPLTSLQGDGPAPREHAGLLRHLGEQFAAHGYRLETLVSWLALSEPFSLADTPLDSERLAKEKPARQRPLFDHYYPQPQLPNDTAWEALVAFAKSRHRTATGDLSTTARLNSLRPGARTSPGVIAADQEPLISAAENADKHDSQPNPLMARILRSSLAGREKVEHLFWLLVHRHPTKRELTLISRLARGQKQRVILDGVRQALVNNRESHHLPK